MNAIPFDDIKMTALKINELYTYSPEKFLFLKGFIQDMLQNEESENEDNLNKEEIL